MPGDKFMGRSECEPGPGGDRLVLRLYITRGAANSVRALANIRTILQEQFLGPYTLEVVDILQDPQRALADGILLTPALVKLAPAPCAHLVGNLSQTEVVLQALEADDGQEPAG